MKRLVPFAVVPLLLAGPIAHAAETTSWDFRGQIPVRVQVEHLSNAESTEEGLFIQSATDGFVSLPVPETRVDALTVTVTNIDTPNMAFIWRTSDMGSGEYYQADVEVPVGQSQRTSIVLQQFPEWKGDAAMVGLAFPAGTELLIESMEWKAYSPIEKLGNAFLSFWTPDSFTLYSINFLWGPLIGVTPEARATLFDTLPPKAWSATRIMYAALALAMIAGGVAWRLRPAGGKRRFVIVLCAAGAALWVLFDARMTQEVASYVAHDWKTYVLRAPGERVLRSHSTLYDVLDRIDGLLGDEPSYVLIAKEGTPFFANVRYKLYPAVPREASSPGDARTWLVLGRPDITVQDGALTASDGTALSPRGTILHTFDAGSYVFRSTP